MAVLSSVLRVLSDFGDAAGWLIAALVLFAYGRRIIQENEKAHAAITESINSAMRCSLTEVGLRARGAGRRFFSATVLALPRCQLGWRGR